MQEKNKKITTIDELAALINSSFQVNQDGMIKRFEYIDKRFEHMDKRFDALTEEMRSGFKKVSSQIDKINLNAVDVVRKEEFEKLETRVTDVEEMVNLKLGKA